MTEKIISSFDPQWYSNIIISTNSFLYFLINDLFRYSEQEISDEGMLFVDTFSFSYNNK